MVVVPRLAWWLMICAAKELPGAMLHRIPASPLSAEFPWAGRNPIGGKRLGKEVVSRVGEWGGMLECTCKFAQKCR